MRPRHRLPPPLAVEAVRRQRLVLQVRPADKPRLVLQAERAARVAVAEEAEEAAECHSLLPDEAVAVAADLAVAVALVQRCSRPELTRSG